MPISAKSMRIGGTSLIAVLMVVGGYVLPGFQFPETKAVNAELTDDILAGYVSKDTDADGLPDWQEVLYGTDSNVADTDGDGISDGEAVRRGLLTPTSLSSQIPSDPIGEEELPGTAPAAGSFTEQFSRTFLTAYTQQSKGQSMTAEAQSELITRLLAEFTDRSADVLGSSYSALSVRTNASTDVMTYANNLEVILKGNEVAQGGGDPVLLMQAYIEKDDASAKPKLETLARSYRNIANALLATSVPPTLSDEHLKLLRAFDSLAKATEAVVNFEEDPLGVMGALTVYAPNAREVIAGLQGTAVEILYYGEPALNAPGDYIVSFARFSENP